jgi:insertion element IS1 protein InsB
VLAYVFGRREDHAFLELKALLQPFGIRRFFTDGWGAYQRHLALTEHEVGKHNTQQIERKHLTLRTRIKRLNQTTGDWHRDAHADRSRVVRPLKQSARSVCAQHNDSGDFPD